MRSHTHQRGHRQGWTPVRDLGRQGGWSHQGSSRWSTPLAPSPDHFPQNRSGETDSVFYGTGIGIRGASPDGRRRARRGRPTVGADRVDAGGGSKGGRGNGPLAPCHCPAGPRRWRAGKATASPTPSDAGAPTSGRALSEEVPPRGPAEGPRTRGHNSRMTYGRGDHPYPFSPATLETPGGVLFW